MALQKMVAMVTGSSEGIGKGIAKSLLSAGATVVLNGRRSAVVSQAHDELASAFGKDRVHSIVADVSQSSEADRLVGEVLRMAGRLDILVNNAGVEGDSGPVETLTDSNLRRVFEVNVFSQFYLCRAAIPHFKERSKTCT